MLTATRSIIVDYPRDTRWFIGRLNAISPGNLRALWMPHSTDTTTNNLKPDGRVWTNSASNAGRVEYRGNGILVSFNGTDQYIDSPDTDDMTFAAGTYSGVAFGTVTGSSGDSTFISKFINTAAGAEYIFRVDSVANTLTVVQWDSVNSVAASRTSDAAITTTTKNLWGFTASAASGATAANNITLYQNGAVIASTASNNASFANMANGSNVLAIGALSGTETSFHRGSLGMVAIYAAALTAAQHKQVNDACRAYYGLAA